MERICERRRTDGLPGQCLVLLISSDCYYYVAVRGGRIKVGHLYRGSLRSDRCRAAL